MSNWNNPRHSYTRDPSLRLHTFGKIEPMESERFHWEEWVIGAIIIAAFAAAVWGVVV